MPEAHSTKTPERLSDEGLGGDVCGIRLRVDLAQGNDAVRTEGDELGISVCMERANDHNCFAPSERTTCN